jgi:hypothetical protein
MRYRLVFISGVAVGYVFGTRAGRERYEQLRKSANRFTQNPAVHDAVKNAKDTGRSVAAKAADAVVGKVGDKLPESVAERVRDLRQRDSDDDWGGSGA